MLTSYSIGIDRCLSFLSCSSLFLFKSALDSYFSVQFRRSDGRISKLEKSKETKLDELIAKTNFKATQQLITRFSEKKKPQQSAQSQSNQQSSSPTKSEGSQPQHPTARSNLPNTPTTGRLQSQTMPASAFKLAHQQHQQQMAVQQQQQQQQQQYQGQPSAPLPSADSIQASQRSSLDKLLDFILNDGPNNKYALICSTCAGHNGLVREQELGKIRFRCAMCGAFNGPPLPPHTAQQSAAQTVAPPLSSSSSSSMFPPMTPATDKGQHQRHMSGPNLHSIPLTPFAPLPEQPLHLEGNSIEAEDENGASLESNNDDNDGGDDLDPAEIGSQLKVGSRQRRKHNVVGLDHRQ